MRYVMPAFAALVLAGCSFLEDDVARGFAQSWSLTPATFTTADVRMITQRNRHGSPNPIICTEPSPDVAKALSTAAQWVGWEWHRDRKSRRRGSFCRSCVGLGRPFHRPAWSA